MPQRELPGSPVVEAVWQQACEDRLGVALIQPGSFRYQRMKAAVMHEKAGLQQGWNRVSES